MREEEALVCGIFEQAFEDYRKLKEKNISISTRNDYSIKEIEQFFEGEWCDCLLYGINSSLTGGDLLRKIKSQCGEEVFS